MNIEPKKITIRELTKGYKDNADEGVVGYGGKLDIRPPYQREFIYDAPKRNAVINTVTNDFPLNVMYWAVREDGTFEVMDGQQRTISICQYVNGDFSVKVGSFPESRAFHNLQDNEQEQIYNYELTVYICSGDPSEKLDWFRTINIAGMKLEEQELQNAVFAGTWISDAKKYFSKINCVAHNLGKEYLTGEVNRQKYLETAIDWISEGDKVCKTEKNRIECYMSKHQHDPNAGALWRYFQDVISWVKATFPIYRKEMKGIEWGILYNKYKDNVYDTKKIEKQILILIDDDDVQNTKGIYTYILTGEDKHLNLRQFDEKIKRKVYEKQKGTCIKCPKDKHYEIEEMEADHVKPWHEGGHTTEQNCQLLCKDHNRRKSGK